MDISVQLKSETVEHAPWEEPLVVSPNAPLRQVIGLMRKQKAGGALVCQGARLVGIFTERDALRWMASRGDWHVSVESVMSRQCAVIRHDTTIAAAIRLMNKGGYRRLPVVNGEGVPLGVLTVAGIVHYLVQFFPRSVYNLPPAPQTILAEREGP